MENSVSSRPADWVLSLLASTEGQVVALSFSPRLVKEIAEAVFWLNTFHSSEKPQKGGKGEGGEMREHACVFPELLIVCTELKNLIQWKLFRLALLFCHITPRKNELLQWFKLSGCAGSWDSSDSPSFWPCRVPFRLLSPIFPGEMRGNFRS